MSDDTRTSAAILKPEDCCACGNGPLTREDRKAGGACACCRDRHLTYHDDQACRRCGCPVGNGSRGAEADQ